MLGSRGITSLTTKFNRFLSNTQTSNNNTFSPFQSPERLFSLCSTSNGGQLSREEEKKNSGINSEPMNNPVHCEKCTKGKR